MNVENEVKEIYSLSSNYDDQIAQWERDQVYSDARKQQQIAALKAEKQTVIKSRLQNLWGTYDPQTGEWAGGVVPTMLANYQQKIESLRNEAIENDPLDQTRLANVIAGLPSRLARLRNIEQVKQAYKAADPYLKRAMQMTGIEQIEKQFASEPGAGSFVAKLQADYESAFVTPELSQLQADYHSFRIVDLSKAAGVARAFMPVDVFGGPDHLLNRVRQYHQPQSFKLETTGQTIFG